MAVRIIPRVVRSSNYPLNVTYRAYGLNLTSSVVVPALHPLPQPTPACDVQIEIGTRGQWVESALAQPAHVVPTSRSREPQDCRFTLKIHGNGLFSQLVYADGSRFLIDANATRIWGEAGPALSDDDLFVYLLGPVLGFVLRKRACAALHASGVVLDGFAVALCGSASFGKSTTAAALALRGVPVLTEDVTPIKELGHTFIVEPGYPRICLWPDSVQELLGSPDALPLLTPNWDKRYLPLDGVRATFEPQSKPLGVIYLLSARKDDSDAPRIEDVAPRQALLGLIQNTYMNCLLNRDQRAAEFDVLSKIVDQIPVRSIVPHADPARLPALCDLIADDARTLKPPDSTRTAVPRQA